MQPGRLIVIDCSDGGTTKKINRHATHVNIRMKLFNKKNNHRVSMKVRYPSNKRHPAT